MSKALRIDGRGILSGGRLMTTAQVRKVADRYDPKRGHYVQMEGRLEGETFPFDVLKREYTKPEVWGPRELGEAFFLEKQDAQDFLSAIEQISQTGFISAVGSDYHNTPAGLCRNGVPVASFQIDSAKRRVFAGNNGFSPDSPLYQEQSREVVDIAIRTATGGARTVTIARADLSNPSALRALAGANEKIHNPIDFAIAVGQFAK
jgi:hypothetical protein